MPTKPSKFFICGRNVVDEVADADIECSESAVATLPLRHLKNSDRDFVWRSSSADDQDLVVSFEATLSARVNFVCLHRHNGETNAKWRSQLYSDYEGGASASPTPLLYDSGLDFMLDYDSFGDLDFGVEPLGGGSYSGFLGQRTSVHYFMENVSDVINSVRVSFNDSGNSAGYVQASRLYVGRGFELAHGAQKIDLSWREDTSHKRTDGGSLLSDGSLTWREMEVEAKLTAAERSELMDMFRWAGMRRDLFVSGYPGVGGEKERDYMMLCRFKEMPRITATPDEQAAGVFPVRFSLIEV